MYALLCRGLVIAILPKLLATREAMAMVAEGTDSSTLCVVELAETGWIVGDVVL